MATPKNLAFSTYAFSRAVNKAVGSVPDYDDRSISGAFGQALGYYGEYALLREFAKIGAKAGRPSVESVGAAAFFKKHGKKKDYAAVQKGLDDGAVNLVQEISRHLQLDGKNYTVNATGHRPSGAPEILGDLKLIIDGSEYYIESKVQASASTTLPNYFNLTDAAGQLFGPGAVRQILKNNNLLQNDQPEAMWIGNVTDRLIPLLIDAGKLSGDASAQMQFLLQKGQGQDLAKKIMAVNIGRKTASSATKGVKVRREVSFSLDSLLTAAVEEANLTSRINKGILAFTTSAVEFLGYKIGGGPIAAFQTTGMETQITGNESVQNFNFQMSLYQRAAVLAYQYQKMQHSL